MKIYASLMIVCVLLLITACQPEKTQFVELPSTITGVTFNNEIPDSDSLNVLDYEYIYNGGGVAIADFNSDGNQDILFTGNIVDNKLYINRGNLKFEDVSEPSGLVPSNRWNTGVAIVDINLDGLLDIYITASGHKDVPLKSNQLYICTGIGEDGTPTYVDRTDAYGLVDSSYSTNSAFFDYDNDGDLDLFVINNHMVEDRQASKYRKRSHDVQTPRTDLLFRNDWSEDLGHPFFTNVSAEAGLFEEGFSLGINTHDFNKDGWLDVLITNDYLTNDVLYVNQRDGTFKNEADKYFKHTSFSAMGMDVVDLDNDGASEIVALDMLPNDNYRKKTMLPPNNYTSYINNDKYGYQYQHVRNTLQKNNFSKRHVGSAPIFSEQSLASGIAATDWSWSPIIADFDNDGLEDIIVTNGFPKDVTDRDFVDYNMDIGVYASDLLLLPKIPSVKIRNVAYKNNSGLSFEDVTDAWGIKSSTFSNGGAYGDLDNDGDLDYIVNNINDEADIYENKNQTNNALQVSLIGADQNPGAVGAQLELYTSQGPYYKSYIQSRGYLSSVQSLAHFGLGEETQIDSLVIIWPDAMVSKVSNRDIKLGAVLKLSYDKLPKHLGISRSQESGPSPLFTSVAGDIDISYVDSETDYNDFNIQPMLLHKLSQYGPGLAVGDANGDGLEDVYISGSHFESGVFLIQQEDGTYGEQQLIADPMGDIPGEELGALLFDVDGDGDDDLYTALGGYEFDLEDSIYRDRLYINTDGVFELSEGAILTEASSSGVVIADDYDDDGDMDIMVGGRVGPGYYPAAPQSALLRNEVRDGAVRLVDVTREVIPDLEYLGMITDAIWSDYDNDGDRDLIVVGEFLPMTVFINDKGYFSKLENSNLSDHIGWWNSITAGDFDADGDTDYILGNYGSQTLAPVSDDHPLSVYFADYDNNGSKDLIPTCWYYNAEGKKEEQPYFGRLEYEKQVIQIKALFHTHDAYARSTIRDIISKEEADTSLVLRANYMLSSHVENNGDGTFEISAMPDEVQLSPVYGAISGDYNDDGHLDVIMIGNDYGTEISIGRMDAHDGILLLGRGDGTFSYQHAKDSGFYVQGDGKAMTQCYNKHYGRLDIMASQNRGPLMAYDTETKGKYFKFEDSDDYAQVVTASDTMKVEHMVGSAYLSQLSNYIRVSSATQVILIYNRDGESRRIEL